MRARTTIICCLPAAALLLINPPAAADEDEPPESAAAPAEQTAPAERKEPAQAPQPAQKEAPPPEDASASSRPGSIHTLTIQDLRVCATGGSEMNLPGALLVALEPGGAHRVYARRKVKPPSVQLGLVLGGTFMEGTFPQQVLYSDDPKNLCAGERPPLAAAPR